MRKTLHDVIARMAGGIAVGSLLWAGVLSLGAAQFHLPKIPSGPKPSKPGTQEVKPSRGSTVEVVSSVSPDSAPPGGHGQLILTGENFKDGMEVRFTCVGADFKSESVKLNSATKAEVQISVPVKAQEGPCEISSRTTPGKEPFRISNSANMPVSVAVALIGEGDMQFMDMIMSIQKAAMAGGGNPGQTGRIDLDGGSIKYVKGGATTFTESISAVKSIGEMKQNEQPLGIFRIVFNDGKIYNFGAMGNTSEAHSTFVFLQKKLGK